MYSGTVISNYYASVSTVGGHPDCELNDCKFKPERCVESDFSCSFHLESDADSYWVLQAPPVQKSNDFNYIVSYGNYTEKVLEWGSVSISIDEINETASPSTWRGRARKTMVPTKVPPRLDPSLAGPPPPGGTVVRRTRKQESGQTGK
nr:MAG: ORF5 [Aeschynomene indica solemo-like virus 1]